MLSENNQGLSLRMVWMHNISSTNSSPAKNVRMI